MLVFQVIHRRVVRQIGSGVRVYQHEWDSENVEVIVPDNKKDLRWEHLTTAKCVLNERLRRMRDVISKLERYGMPYTADRIIAQYLDPTDEIFFIAFGRDMITMLKQSGKRCTAETYETSMNSFARFRQETDLSLNDVSSDLMIAYENYLNNKGVCPNSISFYMRNLRAIYNRAVEKELTKQAYPFRHVYTGVDKTVKRALPLQTIRRLRQMDLRRHPRKDYARDLFLFSLYTRGMAFVDMAFLKKKDLHNGILSYRRHKTNQPLMIKWEKQMQDIIDKYDTSDSPYLLPIINDTDGDAYAQYRNVLHRVNRHLSQLGAVLNLPIPLTTYVARHTWASIAKSKNIAISVISEAMGHDSENTTRIYLASLDTSVIDKANRLVLEAL